jgi:hypothetical protein
MSNQDTFARFMTSTPEFSLGGLSPALGTKNVFHDFPYLSPIEASTYYQTIDAAKLYPLPEATMEPTDSLAFRFEHSLTNSNIRAAASAVNLLSFVEGLSPIFDEDTESSSLVTICGTSAPVIRRYVETGATTQDAVVHRFQAAGGAGGALRCLEALFTALYVPSASRYVIVMEDVLAVVLFGSAEERFALSWMLLGAVSLLHSTFTTKVPTGDCNHQPTGRQSRNFIRLVVSLGSSLQLSPLAALLGARLQLFFDGARVPATIDMDSTVAPPCGWNAEDTRTPPFISSLVELVAQAVADCHEDLCERIEDGNEFSSAKNNLPILVVVAGSDQCLHLVYRSCIARYTPVPMQFSRCGLRHVCAEEFDAESSLWLRSFKDPSAPLIVLLTAAEFRHGRHLFRLWGPGAGKQRIARVVHAGLDAEDRHLSLECLEVLGQPWGPLFTVTAPAVELGSRHSSASLPSLGVGGSLEQSGGEGALMVSQLGELLLCVVRKFSGASAWLRINLHLLPALQLSSRSTRQGQQAMKLALDYLTNAKCIEVTTDDSRGAAVVHVRLTPFGRLASRIFRFRGAPHLDVPATGPGGTRSSHTPSPPFRLEALRAVVWGSLFRFTRGEVEDTVKTLYASVPTLAGHEDDREAPHRMSRLCIAHILRQHPQFCFGQGAADRSLRRLALALSAWPFVCAPEAMEGVALGRAEMALCISNGSRRRFEPSTDSRPVTTCRGWWGAAPAEAEKAFPVAPPVPSLPYPSRRDLCVIATSAGFEDTTRCGTHIGTLPILMSDALLVTRVALHTAFNNTCMLLETHPCQVEETSEEVAGSLLPPPQLPIVLLSSASLHTFADPAVSTTVQNGHGFVANSGAWLDFYLAHVSGAVAVDASLSSLSRQAVSLLDLCRHRVFSTRTEDNSEENLSENSQPSRKRVRDGALPSASESVPIFSGTVPMGKEKQIIDEFVGVCRKIGREAAESKYIGRKGFAFLSHSHVMNGYYIFEVEKKVQ